MSWVGAAAGQVGTGLLQPCQVGGGACWQPRALAPSPHPAGQRRTASAVQAAMQTSSCPLIPAAAPGALVLLLGGIAVGTSAACNRLSSLLGRTPQVLLLDEITVDMDVVGRLDLLAFFRRECEERGATIVYVSERRGAAGGLLGLLPGRLGLLGGCARGPLGGCQRAAAVCHGCVSGVWTASCMVWHAAPRPAGSPLKAASCCAAGPPPQATHIFDGLESWPTHFAYLEGGRMLRGARKRGGPPGRRGAAGACPVQRRAAPVHPPACPAR